MMINDKTHDNDDDGHDGQWSMMMTMMMINDDDDDQWWWWWWINRFGNSDWSCRCCFCIEDGLLMMCFFFLCLSLSLVTHDMFWNGSMVNSKSNWITIVRSKCPSDAFLCVSVRLQLRFYTVGFLSSGANYLKLLLAAERWIMDPATVTVDYEHKLLVGMSLL